MKRLFFLLLFLSLVCAAFAQSGAVIKEIKGKVKLQAPGKEWVTAEINMEVKKGTVVSTGFKSQAVLDLGRSFVTVAALTRMTLEELLERDDVVETDIYLKFGKITAEVKTSDDKKHDFKLKSAVSTAAVRGTKLVYDAYSVYVEHGNIFFLNKLNQKRLVVQGGGSFTAGFGYPDSMADTKNGDFWVSPSTGEKLFPVNPGPSSTGTIEIIW